MFYGGLSSRLFQVGTPRYIGKEHATPSSDPKLSGKSCHTTTRTNQYNEYIHSNNYIGSRSSTASISRWQHLRTWFYKWVNSRICHQESAWILLIVCFAHQLTLADLRFLSSKQKLVQGLSDILLRPFGTVYHLIFVTHHPHNLLKKNLKTYYFQRAFD